MSLTSQQSAGLDTSLLEIEEFFLKRKKRQALVALEKLENGQYKPAGIDKGLYLLLCARRALLDNEYDRTISLCQQALKRLGPTSLNYRIGRLYYYLYKAYAACGKLRKAEMAARDSLASYRRVNDQDGILNAYNALGRVYYLRSDYVQAAEYVNEAIRYEAIDPLKKGQLLGNLGRIYLLTGEMDKAEKNLRQAFAIGKENDLPYWLVSDHLSLGYLQLRRRNFSLAEAELECALNIIQEHGYRREHIICLEYLGELAQEKQDFVSARNYLREAVDKSDKLAPESALMTQSLRRLAEAELALGHQDEAMRLVQQSLDMALEIGEKSEVGLSHRVISAVFRARNEYADARRHGLESIETLREIGDNYELGRSIIGYGSIPFADLSLSNRKTYPLLQEAEKLFTLMGDDYYLSKCHFEMGRFCQFVGKNAEALELLKEAVKGFRVVGDKTGINKVNDFLHSLSESAIARALSDKNEFKVFGNIVSSFEYNNLKSGPLEKLFEVLTEKTAADRAFIVNISRGERTEISVAKGLNEVDYDSVVNKFSDLISDKIIGDTPTLVLDCTGNIEFGDLMSHDTGRTGSVIILPLMLGSDILGYIYLDRLAGKNGSGINPFSQREIDFAVGFADLAAFKASEYQKDKLLEDNLRLKAQLLEKCVFPNIITQSRSFMEVLARIRQVADSNMTISITGETGTGKDILIKAIHYNSNRRDKRLVTVNCAALPESLLESELFGYKRGAFTGADRDKPGLFEEADGGTFFLDEIADMPLAIQAKLLRLLENQEITRLGDTKPRKVDVRVISATNRDLKVAMEEKTFRSDLFYRLCALNFRISPLRERREDIPLLAEHFLTDSKCQISPDTMKYLVDYDWPGNVRELENEIKKLILLSNNEGVITPSLLSSRILGDDHVDIDNGPDETAFYTKDGFSLYDYLAEYEKRFIIKALKEQKGIKKRAADSLNIPESTLRLKLKQYKIDSKNPDRLN